MFENTRYLIFYLKKIFSNKFGNIYENIDKDAFHREYMGSKKHYVGYIREYDIGGKRYRVNSYLDRSKKASAFDKIDALAFHEKK